MPTIVPGLYRPPAAAAGAVPFASAAAVPIRPAAVVVTQGPQGPTDSSFSGFGYVQFMALTTSPILNLAPGVRTPLVMAIDPTQTSNTLKGPFAGFTFWDGSTLSARAVGDLYELRFTLTATSAIAGGTLTTDITINGLTVATDNDSEALSYPAGQPQRVGFKLRLLPKAGFVSGGAQIYLTSTVPVAVTSEVLVIDPTNAGP